MCGKLFTLVTKWCVFIFSSYHVHRSKQEGGGTYHSAHHRMCFCVSFNRNIWIISMSWWETTQIVQFYKIILCAASKGSCQNKRNGGWKVNQSKILVARSFTTDKSHWKYLPWTINKYITISNKMYVVWLKYIIYL